ncbi:hypothetical protein HEMA109418_11455 [Helcobacillus massiliensis]
MADDREPGTSCAAVWGVHGSVSVGVVAGRFGGLHHAGEVASPSSGAINDPRVSHDHSPVLRLPHRRTVRVGNGVRGTLRIDASADLSRVEHGYSSTRLRRARGAARPHLRRAGAVLHRSRRTGRDHRSPRPEGSSLGAPRCPDLQDDLCLRAEAGGSHRTGRGRSATQRRGSTVRAIWSCRCAVGKGVPRIRTSPEISVDPARAGLDHRRPRAMDRRGSPTVHRLGIGAALANRARQPGVAALH